MTAHGMTKRRYVQVFREEDLYEMSGSGVNELLFEQRRMTLNEIEKAAGKWPHPDGVAGLRSILRHARTPER